MADAGIIAGFVVLAVFLLLLGLAVIILVYFFCKKLRQHHEALKRLESKLGNLQGSTNRAFEPDGFQETTLRRHDHCVVDFNNKRPDSGAADLNGIEPSYCEVNLKNMDVDLGARYANRPRYTLIIKEERINIFGDKGDLPQVTNILQDYETEAGENKGVPKRLPGPKSIRNSNIVSIDDVQIDSNKSVILDDVSKVLIRKSVLDGRPTSLLLKTPDTKHERIGDASCGINHEKGMFIHKTIGPDGGEMDISGVQLEVPRGALSECKMITLGITWDTKLMPKLSRKQARISPVIVCSPGIHFRKPVKLTFPHCAVNILSDWNPVFFKRDGDVDEEHSWSNLTLADYEERDINSNSVIIHLKHFTMYTLIGESRQGKVAAKRVKLVAFAKPLKPGKNFDARIYCINDYENEMKEIKSIEESLSGKMSNAPLPMFVHDSGRDVTISLEKIIEKDDWTLIGDQNSSLDFECIWHGLTPYCNFVLKPRDAKVTSVYNEYSFQQQGETMSSSKLKISDECSPVAPIGNITLLQNPELELRRQLIILLDPESSISCDYRLLAEHMNMTVAEIHYLQHQGSPTDLLLDKWFAEGKTWKELMAVLKSLERMDAAEQIEKYLLENVNDLSAGLNSEKNDAELNSETNSASLI